MSEVGWTFFFCMEKWGDEKDINCQSKRQKRLKCTWGILKVEGHSDSECKFKIYYTASQCSFELNNDKENMMNENKRLTELSCRKLSENNEHNECNWSLKFPLKIRFGKSIKSWKHSTFAIFTQLWAFRLFFLLNCSMEDLYWHIAESNETNKI